MPRIPKTATRHALGSGNDVISCKTVSRTHRTPLNPDRDDIRYTVSMATTVRVTLQEFLAAPESKPYRELMDGEVCEKPMPNREHSALGTELIYLLKAHQRINNTFDVDTELRHADVEHAWVFLPDISVTLKSRLPDPPSSIRNPVDVLPDFAIEILSPEDRPGMVTRKITFYRRAGVTLLWIIDPETETITVWERGAEPFEATSDEPLGAAPILPDFTLDIPALFAFIHQK